MAKNEETMLKDDSFLVSETDGSGRVTFANEEFCKIAEYTLEELMGKNHNIVRHPDMPKAAFKDLWDTISAGNSWEGFVKNSTKSGGFYWVKATVYPFKYEDGSQGYISCRRKPSREDVAKYGALYKTMQ